MKEFVLQKSGTQKKRVLKTKAEQLNIETASFLCKNNPQSDLLMNERRVCRVRGRGSAELLCAALFVAVVLALPVHGQRLGEIRGAILDRATQHPLPGASVEVLGRERGTVADAEGRFALPDMAVGVHSLRISMIGYTTIVRTDVVVRSRRVTDLAIELDAEVVDVGEETVVVADYFSDAAEQVVSSVSFSYEEVRRSPGAAGDISRLLQAMPSVNMTTDERNDLIVRGGSPTENLTLIDNIEIPNINHFPTQGASGGPIGLLNTDLIEDTAFYTGGFSAAYGDRLSSVMVVDLREGNREEFEGEVQLGMAGAGLLFEGPLSAWRGSWIASGRRSYLDLIVDAIGTGAVPRYSDLQGKLSCDLSSQHRVSVLGIAGFNAIDFAPGDTDADEDFIVNETDQYVAGVGWRWLWSQRGFAHTSLAISYADFVIDVLDGQTRSELFTNSSQERRIVLRSDVTYAPTAGGEVRWGITGRREFSDFSLFSASRTNRVNEVTPELRVGDGVNSNKLAAYLSYERSVLAAVTAQAGVRWEYFDYNEEIDLSPRLSLRWQIDPLTSLNAAWGLYYQNLPSSLLVQHPDNRQLANPRAAHYVLGLQRRLTENALFTLEGYLKRYRGLPFDPDDPTVSVVDAYADFGTPAPGQLVGGGEAESYGVESMIQKKLAHRLYGTASYAYARSRYTDFTGQKRNRSFDNRHLVSLIVGYRHGETWEYSLRWRFAGGRPYTPFDAVESARQGTGIVQRDRINELRLPPYHRLDLRFDHRRYFERFNIVSFFTLLNAYNRANLFTYYWDESDHRQGRINQWSRIPVGGFELEF